MKLNIKAFALTGGLLWALADGLIGGALFAWVYNRFAAIKTAEAE